MQHGRNNKGKGGFADVEGISLLDHKAVEVAVDDGFQVFLRGRRTHHGDVGVELQQFQKAAGMVELGVVHDEIVDGGDVHQALEIVEVFVEIVVVNRLDEHGLFVCDQVGVVGGAEGRLHDDVKHPQRGVEHADRIDVIG